MKKLYQLLCCMVTLMFSLNAALAQSDWPSKPIRIIVPFAAGGNTDIVARITAIRLSQILGQPVSVENKAGSGGMIATDFVAKSPPDGYTLLMSSTGPHTVLPSLMKKVPYNPLTDLAPVSNISSNALVLLVNPKLPVNNVSELIALAKKEPGKMSFSSAGIGATKPFSILGGLAAIAANFEMVGLLQNLGIPVQVRHQKPALRQRNLRQFCPVEMIAIGLRIPQGIQFPLQ
jgi:tripartite-type tricarboxylate transporter receptor subunit TctC